MKPAPHTDLRLALNSAGYHPILQNLTLDLAPGRLVAVIGPNGAGKSTLLRLLAGYVKPTSGKATLGTQECWAIPGRVRGGLLGYLPQQVETSFPFTVLELVQMGLLASAGPLHTAEVSGPHQTTEVSGPLQPSQSAVESALANLGIGELKNRVFPTLSGGEQRLVLAAKMLVQRPTWMLLDEPTEALDWPNARKLLAELQQRSTGGHGVLAVLHDLNLVWQLGLDVLLLHRGQVVYQGPSGPLPLDLLSSVYGSRFSLLSHPVSGAPVLVEG